MELMLLAGEAVGAFGAARGVPLPYRSQSIGEASETHAVPDGPCHTWSVIKRMSPFTISAAPQPHEGLGIDTYVQMTSPIRRFADLAVHYQLKAALRGEPLPYSGAREGELMRLAKEGSLLPKRLERRANEYWLCEFLRRQGASEVEGLVLGFGRGRHKYKVLLTELGALVDHKSVAPLKPGERLRLSAAKLGGERAGP